MPRRPAAYPAAYREQLIALARAGRSPKELAKEFEPSEQTIRNWLFQDGADRGERPETLTAEERMELQRLRRENAVLVAPVLAASTIRARDAIAWAVRRLRVHACAVARSSSLRITGGSFAEGVASPSC